MGKTIFVIVCLLAIIVGGIFEQVYVDKTLTELENKLHELETVIQAEDMETAAQKVNSIQEWWYTKSDFLEFMCPNNDVKDFAKELGELQGAIETDADSDPLIRCNVIVEMAKNSKCLLAFKWKNVF